MTASPTPEAGREIIAGGIRTHYHEAGAGAPVILIHGSGPGVSAWVNWRNTMPALAAHFRVLAPDMLGFGRTQMPSGPIRDKAVWVDHLVAFLDALGIGRASLVGNSFGGSIALAMAIRHPERVERLVLMGPTGVSYPITEALDYVWGYEPSIGNMRQSLGYLASDPTRLTDELVDARYAASIAPGVHEPYAATFGEAPRQRHLDMLASDPADIAAVNHEVLILQGRQDQVIPSEASLRLAGLLPRCDAIFFGRCGHWVQIERAAAFNRVVARFLREGLEG